ncbi:hypothetical protein HPP92_008661 [Vanilla planifolia]|uniref:Glycosyltransferase N-terminal domain-containing protein n=1 Tax=Vanilla planifolia TaxID=51239 RepID=A0A835V3Z6_VANPL|nr:hypothetical protein HPP92_008661 [Vanilla planifolia]
MESKEARQPHFVLVPFMAPGHMIPMVDMAHLLADRPGIVVTIVTTPVNALRISSITDAVARSSLPIRFVTLPFPAAEFGLPDGCENLDILPSRELAPSFLDATRTLRAPLEHHLRTTVPPPSCIISDSGHPWTIGVARDLHIPRVIFHGFGCMALLCLHVVREYKLLEKTGNKDDDDKAFEIPGFPDQIQMTRAQLPGYKSIVNESKYREEIILADAASDGVVVNSFDDLEPSYREYYEKAIRKRVWTIGPMLLSSRTTSTWPSGGTSPP